MRNRQTHISSGGIWALYPLIRLSSGTAKLRNLRRRRTAGIRICWIGSKMNVG